MSEPIFLFDSDQPEMQKAYRSAQNTFRYFWRELSWESRRIIPALDLAIVKLPFTDGARTDGNPEHEQMWISDIDFDGDFISGALLNSPNWLISVKKGQQTTAPLSHLTDWMITANGRAYGGFTVNLMRAGMNKQERLQHDQAWGLDFGDPSQTQIEIYKATLPKAGLLNRLFGRTSPVSESFQDHPMCVNMLPKIKDHLNSDPGLAKTADQKGWTRLHYEAQAGNLGVVKLLLDYGADPAAQTPNGYTPADLAQKIGWKEVAEYISGATPV